ncbi:putative protein phosphatase 2C-like [Trypanosoma vivax]|uniref:PPM-type phosphatase domain-containing protein n=1 Tax=Trypanosoma vivax (strain Y486) TaxID=1055687 RepID=G0U6E4_TRYVY|nr:putative protein phosphatase 2C-like [Trypanosoma vivax]CCC51448.1 putative protein phosphatase 2C-like [Trypanosoma vivax Y486]
METNKVSNPIIEKHTSTFQTSHFHVGCSAMQGWRKTMEDSHVAHLTVGGDKHCAFLGVFDGHAGSKIAKYCSFHLFDELSKTPEFMNGQYEKAFLKTFESFDTKVCNSTELRYEGGTTANCVFINKHEIFCANTGDCRAVLYRGNRTVPLSVDHKPSDPVETERILNGGGTLKNNRVNGTLAVSRAIGDFELKDNKEKAWDQQIVTALPDITKTEITTDDAFIVVGSDGIWEVLGNDACCDFINSSFAECNDDIGLVCEKVLQKCLAPKPSDFVGIDNMTIIIAKFMPEFFKNV